MARSHSIGVGRNSDCSPNLAGKNMTSSRKKPGMAFWATVVVVLAVLYPLAYGPWWYARGKWGSRLPVEIARYVFKPVELALHYGPDFATEPFERYCLWCFHKGQDSTSTYRPLTPPSQTFCRDQSVALPASRDISAYWIRRAAIARSVVSSAAPSSHMSTNANGSH